MLATAEHNKMKLKEWMKCDKKLVSSMFKRGRRRRREGERDCEGQRRGECEGEGEGEGGAVRVPMRVQV